MSGNFKESFGEAGGPRSRRAGTVQSLVDPLEGFDEPAMLATAVEPLQTVKSEDNDHEATNLNNNHRHDHDEDNGSQYTLDSDELDHHHNEDLTPILEDEKSDTQIKRTQSLQRRNSMVSNAVSKLKKRKTLLMVLRVYLEIYLFFLGLLALYWGSFYHRYERYADLRFLVVNEDLNIQGMSPYLGQAFNESFAQLAPFGDWHIYDTLSFQRIADQHNNTIEQEFRRQIHHQNYWGGFRIVPNATYSLYDAMVNLDTQVINSTLVECAYESSRDILGMMSYIEPNLRFVMDNISNTTASAVFEPLVTNHLSLLQRTSLIANASEIVTANNLMKTVDLRPLTAAAAIGPSLMGLVYCLVLSFYQFSFSAAIHTRLVKQLKSKDFIAFRLLSSQVTFLLFSFIYCLMTLLFQIPVTTTFGHSGFLVLWATIFLYFGALGGINENVAIMIAARDRTYIGFWIVFFIISNVSTTFYPLLLCPKFYRYGYALPMKNAHEIMNVIFFDTYKGVMGRSYGVLIAWIVICNIALPYTLKSARKRLAAAAVAAAALEALKKQK